MSALELSRNEALAHIRALQAQGRSFESIAAVLTPCAPKAPRPDERVLAQQAEIARLQEALETERAARKAAESVLAARCRELLALRESHDLANESLKVLDRRLKHLEQGGARRGPEVRPWWKR